MFCHDEKCLFSLVFSLKDISCIADYFETLLRQAELRIPYALSSRKRTDLGFSYVLHSDSTFQSTMNEYYSGLEW
jgi:hypothetical protein